MRAIALRECGGNADRIRAFHASFRRPVWPGDTLTMLGYRLEPTDSSSRVGVSAFAGGRPEAVVTACWAELDEH